MNVHTFFDQHQPARLNINHTSAGKPIHWLRAGFIDMLRNPVASISHGLAISALIFITLLMTSVHIYAIAAAISAFMFIGPIMAAGLCELSRRYELGEDIGFDESLAGLKPTRQTLNHIALILLSISIIWFLFSGIVLSVTVGNVAPPLIQSLWGDFSSMLNPTQLMLYVLVGGVLAIAVFSISVVTIPVVLDKNLNAVDAMILSLNVTMTNIPTMLVWGLLLVSLSALGFMTFLLAMIIIYPLLGHATWHAYRDLISSKD